jgi:hypothetical protein
MTTWVLSVSLLLSGALQDGTNSSAKGEPETSSKQVTARRYHEINRDLRALLREQATAKTPGQQTLVIRKLVRLYGEICQHPDLATSDTLKSYRIKLRGRLLRIQQELERDIARQEKRSGQTAASGISSARLADAATKAMADQLSLIGYSLGGPGKVFSQGGAMGPPDYGPALVELIQRTIAPGFWDVNGGPGTIVYYAPLRALVVRATGEIHGNLRGALGGLRRAGN